VPTTLVDHADVGMTEPPGDLHRVDVADEMRGGERVAHAVRRDELAAGLDDPVDDPIPDLLRVVAASPLALLLAESRGTRPEPV
jgi:hypothetical protein